MGEGRKVSLLFPEFGDPCWLSPAVSTVTMPAMGTEGTDPVLPSPVHQGDTA